MNWLDKIKNSLRPDTSQPMSAANPQLLGQFLVFSLIEGQFGLDENKLESYVSELPENLKELVKSWAKIYLAWVFRMCVRAKHGDVFCEQMMVDVSKRFARVEDAEIRNTLTGILPYWFEKLDEMIPSIGKKFQDMEVPFEVFAALPFLYLDDASPFYQKEETELAEFEIAEVFVKAKQDTITGIQQVVDFGY